jgi:hypothetical protein
VVVACEMTGDETIVMRVTVPGGKAMQPNRHIIIVIGQFLQGKWGTAHDYSVGAFAIRVSLSSIAAI